MGEVPIKALKTEIRPAFEPWKGSLYAQGFRGVRLLILGESQYSGSLLGAPALPKADETYSTREFVEELGIGGPAKNRPFWTKVTRLVTGAQARADLRSEERWNFWHRVAFYNYIQRWMPAGKRSISAELWAEAEEPFKEIVQRLEPEMLVVLSQRLAAHIPSVSGLKVVVTSHPAAVGFTYSPWQQRIAEGIAEAKKKKAPKPS